MLKNCIIPTTYNEYRNSKCGEIICQTETSFTIVCSFCQMKLFEYDDFLLHFRNVHLEKLDQRYDPQNTKVKLEEIDGSEEVKVIEEPTLLDEIERNTKNEETNNLEESLIEISEHQHQPNTNYESANEDSYDDPNDDDDWNKDDEIDSNDEEEPEGILLKTKLSSKENKCDQCNKNYTSQNSLKAHIRIQHLKPKPYKCDRCSAEFAEERSLQSHLGKMHIGFPCPQCDKVYKSHRGMRVHTYSHREVKEYVCDFANCNKAFVSQGRLTAHKHVHSENPKYVCEMCGYRTRQHDSLVVHKRSHTGEKPYACKLCDRRFASSSLLVEHQPMHSTERPHKCDVCGASFSRPKALYHHKHLHLGIKKFVCKICGNKYAQAAGLSGHMRQHKVEAIF